MNLTVALLLLFLIVCALAVSLTRDLLTSVLILMGYSTVMSMIWLLLESPDLAITEAAVGAGATSILFFITLRRIGILGGQENGNDPFRKSDGQKKSKKATFRPLHRNTRKEDGTR